ncbi:proline-rich protein 2-like [Hyaena hyaena]|uniref:proline-rich protein 2-like n=1 Tax=Hyaena hyaena TaxID=95912 RepID=UPI001920AF8A|nr:proline-rich protein 2-like [Hyaena hyaena]
MGAESTSRLTRQPNGLQHTPPTSTTTTQLLTRTLTIIHVSKKAEKRSKVTYCSPLPAYRCYLHQRADKRKTQLGNKIDNLIASREAKHPESPLFSGQPRARALRPPEEPRGAGRKLGVWKPGTNGPPPRFPERAVPAAQEVPEAAPEGLDPARERSATEPRPPRPSRASPAPPPGGVPPGRPRGAPRPLRDARGPLGKRNHELCRARWPPTWREFGSPSTRRCLGPRGARQPPVRGAGEQSAEHRRDQRRREPPATPRPAPPSSQLRGAPGPGRGRGSRREARGARRAGPLGTRRGHAHSLERAPPGRETGGEGGGRRAQLLLPIFSLVSC